MLAWAHVQIFLPNAVAAFFHRRETRVPIAGDPGDHDSFCCRTAETKKYYLSSPHLLRGQLASFH